jgi:hypothetical protein
MSHILKVAKLHRCHVDKQINIFIIYYVIFFQYFNFRCLHVLKLNYIHLLWLFAFIKCFYACFAQKLRRKWRKGGITVYRVNKRREGSYLEVGLAVERGGEGHVVERAGRRRPAVGWHARHAVLRLVRRQLAPQLLRSDVWLPHTIIF